MSRKRIEIGPFYKLVLMDLHMPEMDGKETTVRLLDMLGDRAAEVQIFACTAYDSPEEKQKCIKVGMQGLISKPPHIEILRSVLSFLLINY